MAIGAARRQGGHEQARYTRKTEGTVCLVGFTRVISSVSLTSRVFRKQQIQQSNNSGFPRAGLAVQNDIAQGIVELHGAI